MLALALICTALPAALVSSPSPDPVAAHARGSARLPVPTVYVDPTGNDTTGDGTAANPFRSLQRAHDVVDSGGTILARAGAYPFAVAVSKAVRIERDGTGTVTLGPPDVGTVTLSVAASDVAMRDMVFAGGNLRAVDLASGDRLSLTRCRFAGGGLGAVRLAGAASTGHTLLGCTFQSVRAAASAVAVEAQNVTALAVDGCAFADGDFGIRLRACANARVLACTFVDHFQSAVVVDGGVDLVLERCRITRCGHFATPLGAATPNEALASVSLVGGSARARVLRTVIEDGGGYTGKNTFRGSATTLFDGWFGLAVLDSADVLVQDSSLHRNRFGGVWVGGTSTGLRVQRCNFVSNGSENDPGKDVALYSDGLTVLAADCFFGGAAGPSFDGAGFGNGVLGGTVTTTPFADAPFDAVAFGVVDARATPAADRSVALAIADLTSDGWNELIAVGDRAGVVQVHLNSATGFTATETTLLAGARPVALATGLLDGDVQRDVVVADELGANVLVLLGDGAGRLPTTRTVAVRRRPLRLATGEWNGQAGVDLAVACQGDAFGPGGVLVLRNDGAGNFTSLALSGAVAPCAVVGMDLDGDTDTDIVAFDLDPTAPGLRTWLHDGAGGFAPVVRIAVDVAPVTDASLALLDQDGGALDLAVATFQLTPLPGVGRVRLFRGDGAGGFAAPLLLRTRAAPLELLVAHPGGQVRPSLLLLDRSAHTVVALGPIASDTGATFPYAQTFGATPLQVAAGALTNRTTADLAVTEAATGMIVTQRGRRAATVVPYGNGCPGAGGVPRARSSALPQIGCTTFAFGFEGAAPNAGGVLVLGVASMNLPLPGGCFLLVDRLLDLGASGDSTGAGALPFPIPDFGGLLGAQLFGQWFLLDPAGSLFGALATTGGLHVTVGG